MRKADFSLQAIRDNPRLKAYAESNAPAWLWARDGTRILWANAAGLQFFGARSENDLIERAFGPADRYRRQIAYLAGRLPVSGAPRFERLPGFGAAPGFLMTCALSRIEFCQNTSKGEFGVLVAAAHAPGRRPVKQAAAIPVVAEPTSTERMAPMDVGAGPEPAGSIVTGELAEAPADGLPTSLQTGLPTSLPPMGKTFPMDPLANDSAPFHDPSAPSMPPDSNAEPAGTATKPGDGDAAARRDPLRFTWQMDADGHFSFGSDEFTRLIGARTAAAFGRSWSEIDSALHLDPDGRLSAAMATHDAFGGIVLQWPADDFGDRLPVEMSGLPLFDREHRLAGYRGFGICRDLEGLSRIAAQRARDTLFGAAAQDDRQDIRRDNVPDSANEAVPSPSSAANPDAQTRTQDAPSEAMSETPDPPVQEAALNVVPFRVAGGDAKPSGPSPALTPVETNAFQEIARQLAERLENEAGRLLGERAQPTPSGQEPQGPLQEPMQGSTQDSMQDSMQDSAAGTHAEAIEDLLADDEPLILMRPSSRSLARHAPLFDHLPLGVLVYQLDRLLYANQAFLDATGYRTLSDLAGDGGLEALYVTSKTSGTAASEAGTPVSIATKRMVPAPGLDAKLHAIDWDSESAHAVILAPQAAPAPVQQAPAPPPVAAPAETETPRITERLANAKADVLARISHDVRTPINAIIGFADVMIEERFGPLGNERYIDYMKDIRASGERVIAIVDEMLDLSRIESGKLDLAFTDQDLNSLIEQCVAAMQPQANRERIIIRSSLTHGLPNVHADARSLRQIALNLIGCSIHLANAGGQVIVSTAITDLGDVALRIRDTGHGMNDNEIAAAMAPFRAAAPPAETSLEGSANLSLIKALVEANRGRFNIKSAPNAGTLIEVVFDKASAAG